MLNSGALAKKYTFRLFFSWLLNLLVLRNSGGNLRIRAKRDSVDLFSEVLCVPKEPVVSPFQNCMKCKRGLTSLTISFLNWSSIDCYQQIFSNSAAQFW